MLRIEIPQLIDLGKATCQRRKSLKFTAVGTYRFNFSLTNRVTLECSRDLVVAVRQLTVRRDTSTELTFTVQVTLIRNTSGSSMKDCR